MAPQIVTAYRLSDGHVVYLDAGGAWSNWIDNSRIAMTEEAGAELMMMAEAAARESTGRDSSATSEKQPPVCTATWSPGRRASPLMAIRD